MLNEVLFVVSQLFPIFHVLSKINLFCGPEGSFLILVHLPDVVVLNREHDESVGVLLEEWFWEETLGLCVASVLGNRVVMNLVDMRLINIYINLLVGIVLYLGVL